MKNFFMDRCSKDEPRAKGLVWKKLFPFQRKTRKTCWGGGIHPPPMSPSEGYGQTNKADHKFQKDDHQSVGQRHLISQATKNIVWEAMHYNCFHTHSYCNGYRCSG